MSAKANTFAAAEKIDKGDLKRLFFRSNAIQSGFNFERMQGLGFIWALLPLLKKLYKSKEDRIEAFERHSGYFNTHPWLVGIIFGVVASMEERKANTGEVEVENIQAVKGALMGPLAGLGDSLFFSTYRPILAGICASLMLSGISGGGGGSILIPLVFVILLNAVHFGAQWWGVHAGYRRADKFLEQLGGMKIQRWMEAATILGLIVVGALVATNLGIATKLSYTVGEGENVVVTSIQSMFDRILPKMLPLGATLGVFAILRKGKNPTIVMAGIVVIAFVLGLLGVI